MTRTSTGALTVLWLAKLVAAGALGFAAYHKFTGNSGDVELFGKLGMEPGGRFVIAVVEALAALLIIVPQTSVYGALLGLCVMVGAIIGHLTAFQLNGIQYAALVLVACITILYIRRHDAKFLRNLLDR